MILFVIASPGVVAGAVSAWSVHAVVEQHSDFGVLLLDEVKHSLCPALHYFIVDSR